ncbi:phospholipase D family protein [Vibrio scophthalmi]|uniref:phospholipase D family protein n=1 Tax=Vibrio scophthalmi TaxID=45658 RepID=UPI003AAC2594
MFRSRRTIFHTTSRPTRRFGFYLRTGLLLLITVLVATALYAHFSRPDSVIKASSLTLPLNPNTKLGQLATHYMSENQTSAADQSGFYPLSDGQEALLARIALIENSEQSLDLQYYIYRDDSTSSLLTHAIFQAAERGVRVRILLDDMQSRSDSDMAALAAHDNIELRLFNAFDNRVLRMLDFLTNFSQMNRRMHNKALIADSAFAIAGGRNIGDEYFAANHDVDFGDFDLLLAGNSVAEISHQFDLYWNSTPATPIEALVEVGQAPTAEQVTQWQRQLRNHFDGSEYSANINQLPLMRALNGKTLPLYWGEAKVYYDQPSKVYQPDQSQLMLHSLGDILSQADSSFVLVSPYFVPTQAGTDLLTKAAQEGLDITIITNSLASNDVFAVHGWYAKYRKQLIESGINLYEVKADPQAKKNYSWLGSSRTSLHAKTFVIDGRKIFAGSFNFDPRSAFLNTEMGVLINAPEFVTDALMNVDDILHKSAYQLMLDNQGNLLWINHQTHRRYDSEPDTSIWLRIGAWIAGILPIETQL